MNYSVLMSVYDKEKPEYLKQSIGLGKETRKGTGSEKQSGCSTFEDTAGTDQLQPGHILAGRAFQ